jgi:hypothetical protein
MKQYGIKCLFTWTDFNGTTLGIEEVIFLVRAKNRVDAFNIATKRSKLQESRAKRKGDWNIKLLKDNMVLYEISETQDTMKLGIEVFSYIHHYRRNVNKAIRDLLYDTPRRSFKRL